MKTLKPYFIAVSAGLILQLAPVFSYGQSITLTSPLSTVQLPDGDDFATSLAEPWDMNQTRDIAYEYGFAPASSVGGIWSATSLANTPFYFYPLSPGFIRPNYTNYFSWYDEGTPYSPLNPINANKYRRLAIRSSLSQNIRNLFTVFWTKNYFVWPSAYGAGINFQDGEPSFNSSQQYVSIPTASGFRIYDFDMNGSGWFNDRVQSLAFGSASFGSGWDGTVYGFQIWPTTYQGPAGQVCQVDWIRLYDPNTSPNLTINWNTSGVASDGRNSVQIFVDSNNSGFNGDLFMTAVANDGSCTIKTAALPPGDYYIYLKVVRHQNSTISTLDTSGYSGLIRIGQPPVLEFTAPSFTSGEDYATAQLGNPWDMSDAADVYATAQITSPQISGGQFTGVTAPPNPGVNESDDQVYLNMRVNGQIVPINTAKYRYLTYRMAVDSNPGYVSTSDRIARGWESRFFWWNSSPTADGCFTKDIPIFNDWHAYTVDLWSSMLPENDNATTMPQNGWRALSTWRTLRFDPMEAHIPTRFWVDDVKLCAENTLDENDTYTIAWNLTDSDSAQVNVILYYGWINSSGAYVENSSPIASLQRAPGAGSFVWAPPTNLEGTFYIRTAVSDSNRTNSYRSKVPVIVGPHGSPGTNTPPPPPPTLIPTSQTVPVWGDFDGDGESDQAVYEKATGNWFIKNVGASTSFVARNWGSSGMDPVPGDYNGDGKSDLAVYERATGKWYVMPANGGTAIIFGTMWGSKNMDPVPGDYDGDGKSDLAVYERTTGKWYILKAGTSQNLAYGLVWGSSSRRPVAGDYNGDGKSDLAVYDRVTAKWYIRSLSSSTPLLSGYNWGTANMDPVTGDYDNDGRSDLAVYERASGKWYVLKINTMSPLTYGTVYGGSSMDPAPGDYNGDGRWDLGVYQRLTGLWYAMPAAGGSPIINGNRWGWSQN